MDNVLWIRIRSWHAASGATRGRTVCGRNWFAWQETAENLPAEKSCETCLRIVARKADAA